MIHHSWSMKTFVKGAASPKLNDMYAYISNDQLAIMGCATGSRSPCL